MVSAALFCHEPASVGRQVDRALSGLSLMQRQMHSRTAGPWRNQFPFRRASM